MLDSNFAKRLFVRLTGFKPKVFSEEEKEQMRQKLIEGNRKQDRDIRTCPEKLIRGLEFAHSGNISILMSDIKEMEITPDGIHYLKENSRMEKIGETLRRAVDVIADIAGLL